MPIDGFAAPLLLVVPNESWNEASGHSSQRFTSPRRGTRTSRGRSPARSRRTDIPRQASPRPPRHGPHRPAGDRNSRQMTRHWEPIVQHAGADEGVARGIRQDYAAVRNGLSLPHSSGACEGNVNEILEASNVRASGVDLLRKRAVLLA